MYDPSVQKYVLSELDSGQRVVTERLTHVRSVALGFWIGAGSRDERDERAGVSHFIEHLLFKGTQRYSAQQIAEIFDALGGELNAATSREHTVVYARVADHHLDEAIDVMSDMVYAPLFAEVDSEREVVLEEIAMYEDTPQELVHDLIAEAVFGHHPLGRPVIGTAEVISSVSRRSITAYHRSMYVPGNVVVAAAGNLDHNEVVGLVEGAESAVAGDAAEGSALAPAARDAPAARPPLPAQGHRAVPRVPRRARNLALRPPPLRRLDPRRDPRRLGLVAALPGDPREAGDGLRRLHVRVAVHGHRPDRPLRRHAGGEPRRVPRDRRRADRRHRRRQPEPNELERAKENLKGRILLSMEATSSRMSRLGKSLITDTEMLSLDRIIAEIDAVEADNLAELAGVLLAPERLSAAAIGPSEDHFLAAVERVNPGACDSRAA